MVPESWCSSEAHRSSIDCVLIADFKMAVVLGLGNPLLDISIEVADLSLCDKYGLKMGNAILAGEKEQVRRWFDGHDVEISMA